MRNVLVVHLDSVGDVLLAGPAIRAVTETLRVYAAVALALPLAREMRA